MSTEAESGVATVDLPKGATIALDGRRITATGPKGSVARLFPSDILKLEVEGARAVLTLKVATRRRRDRSLLSTWAAHLANLSTGVTVGFTARMKAVAAHFPMKVSVEGSELKIENFLGEKHPRSATLLPGVSAVVDGDYVLLNGHDIEAVGQSAANIERATRIRDYDPRVFQDGIFLVDRAHPPEA